ncbi:MAG: glutamate 5-kinase [Actinomycetales bacterium mxb001]|nr:MAG: glutamate 5-kinase [Actinomycetales bacterium mxb001]
MTSASARSAVADAARIVVKVGSSSLARPGGGVDTARVRDLVEVLAQRAAAGSQVLLVSSGAIATGFPRLGLTRRPRDLATQQAAASVGQGLLLSEWSLAFADHGITVGQVLLTADDMTRRAHYRNAQRTFEKLLEMHVIPIVNENDTVATDEIKLGDNDRLAALVAHLVHADALVLLSDVDGLYDGPPGKGGATLIPSVADAADLSGIAVGGVGEAGVGLGGMTTKVEAARIATAAGIPVVLARASAAASALAGEDVGTVFLPTGRRTPTRLLWLTHASTPQGRLYLDDGAVNAVTVGRKSLLPAGVTRVEGDFSAGDPVDLLDQNGHAVARGLVNFDASELPELIGRSTRDLARERGPAYEREVIHRDDLVILDGHPTGP